MAPHEEYLELCAAATAGELSPDERAKLDAHLAVCPDCRRAMEEYEVVSQHGMAALASELAGEETETASSWSAEKAEESFFKRLNREQKPREHSGSEEEQSDSSKRGQRFTYRPSQIRWREVWMPFAAAVFLSLALGIVAYRTGVKRGTDVGRTTTEPPRESAASLEEQVSDRGHERTQLAEKLAKEDKIIADLRHQLSDKEKDVNALKAASGAGRAAATGQPSNQISSDAAIRRDEDLATAQAKSQQLEKTIDILTGQREELTSRAATLEAKVGELTQLVREREQEIDGKQEEVAKQQVLLERDRDIRDLMGARDLHIAEVHDVAGTGETNKTYGRIFYTKGKRLIFYATTWTHNLEFE